MTNNPHSSSNSVVLPAALVASVFASLLASYLFFGPSSKIFLALQFSAAGSSVMCVPALVPTLRFGNAAARAIASLIAVLPVALLLASYFALGLRSSAFLVAAFGYFAGAVTLGFQSRS